MIAAGLAHIVGTSRQTKIIESRLQRWRIVYELNDQQVEQLRKIETLFHGSGNPFAPPRPTAAEKNAHREQIAAVLPPAAAKRFQANPPTVGEAE